MNLVVWTFLLLSTSVFFTTAGRSRAKRVVGLRKNSKFYLRMNFKDTILESTTLFVHAAGFKVTWDVPEGVTTIGSRRPIRALHDDIEFLFDRHGFDGKSCLLNNICQATEYVSKRSGVVAKILRLLLRYSGEGNDTSTSSSLICDDYESICPLTFAGIDTLLG